MAYDIVTNFGMSEKVGHRSYPPPSDGQLASQRPYSEETAQIVDEEVRQTGTRLGRRASHTRAAPHHSPRRLLLPLQVRQIAKEAYDRTYALLSEKKELARQLAELLLEKEVILREDVESVLGERPWKEASSFGELAAGEGNSSPEAAAAVGGASDASRTF